LFLYCLVVVLLAPWVCISISLYLYNDNKDHSFIFQELSALKCDQLLSSGKMLPSECVRGLVEVAGDPHSSPVLTGTVVSLLARLGQQAPRDFKSIMIISDFNLDKWFALM